MTVGARQVVVVACRKSRACSDASVEGSVMRRFIIVLVLALLVFGIAAAPASANWPKYDKIPNAAFFVPGPNIWYQWLGANKYSDDYDAALTPIPAGYSVYLASFFSDGVRANAEQVPGHSLLLSGTIWDGDGNVVGQFPEAFIALTWSPVFHDNNSGWVRESVIPVGVLASGDVHDERPRQAHRDRQRAGARRSPPALDPLHRGVVRRDVLDRITVGG